MKLFRLTAWPDLNPELDRTPYRRMLNDMSHRHVTLAQLTESSGLRRREVRRFVDMLCARGFIGEQRVLARARRFAMPTLRPVHWLRTRHINRLLRREASQRLAA